MAKRSTRAAAASAAVAAGGAVAAGKLVRDRFVERAERKRARRYRLDREESPSEGIDRIARGQLDLAAALLEGREDGGPEAVHEARKALKRLRAVLRLSRDYLGEELFGQENTILRDAGRSLSGIRDARVLVETLDGLAQPLGEELPEGTWSRFHEALAAEARGLEATDGRGDANAKVVPALLGVRTRVDMWHLPEGPGPKALAPGLERIYSRARRAHRRARNHTTPETLHELRKRTKDVWHCAQLLDEVRPKRVSKLRRRAQRLADVLGEDHDLTVLLERARTQPEAFGPGELELLESSIEARRRVFQAESLARAAKLYRRKPRKLIRRLALA